MLNLSYGGAFDPRTGVLTGVHNAGFFSNCTVVLWNLGEVRKRCGCWPERIDFSGAFSSYRDPGQVAERTDMYPLYFESDTSVVLPMFIPRVKHHGFYRQLDHQRLQPVMRRYFKPSRPVLAVQQELLSRYKIDLEKTIGVIYRGTDKGIEVDLASPEAYLRQAESLAAAYPDHRILIQTDEAAVRDRFLAHFGARCFALNEMPVSGGGIAVHDMDDSSLRLKRSEFGMLLVAVTHLLSRAHIVVNHTGNLGLWVCLWRGHSEGLIQFDRTGRVVDFNNPGFWVSQARSLVRRAWSKLGAGPR